MVLVEVNCTQCIIRKSALSPPLLLSTGNWIFINSHLGFAWDLNSFVLLDQ